MKNLVTFSAFLLVILLTTGIASAGVYFGFSFPPVVIGSAAVVASGPAYYPYHHGYFGYGPGYYGYRAWVPGYWERVWTGYGWQRVWQRGYWQYR